MTEHLSDQTVFVLLLAALAFVILALTRLFDWFQRHGSFAAADFWLALFTLALVIETAFSLYILDKTDTALHSAALAANDANKLNAVGLRPWVDFDLFDVGAGFIVTADTVNFGAKFSLKNSGRLPALMTNQNFKILPLPAAPGQSNEIADLVLHDQRQVCKGTEYPSGNTVFPGQSLSQPYDILIPSDRRVFNDFLISGRQIFVVLVTGCVGYQLATAGNHGHTGASILVGRGSGAGPLALPPEGAIQPAQLVKFRVAVQFAD